MHYNSQNTSLEKQVSNKEFPDLHSPLLPWLLYIKARMKNAYTKKRSSYSCRYFVLPCCFFNFYGKYNRKSSKKTQYREYLDFVTDIGTHCGFSVEEDCLRIPSTKRVCLIGKSRNYPPEKEEQIDRERKKYIASHSNDTSDSACTREDDELCDHSTNGEESSNVSPDDPEMGHGKWLSSFQPRDKVEQIRNCVLLPRDFIDKVVLQVAKLLLHLNNEENPEVIDKGTQATWNRGSKCLFVSFKVIFP
ncbi:hypothetical protein AB205_0055330 [Aquarana catesbeiana]|uniref:tRNA (uracil-O(2)-)-methyltransferase n=1 Tax=Aquarana catesbeiana TaxID=8400 RepID=A0A2G9S0S0_AQUCT|nr:hypothetical protein AB205_0055330 [Aquarana catesbeiana]